MPELQGAPLQVMHPMEIPSRDGLKLPSYLTLPPGSDSDGDGRPDQPVPMVLLVHGGPWARDGYGFNSLHQLLANRGYAVLSTNFRGSTRSEEHTSELQSLMRISYAVFCLKKKKKHNTTKTITQHQ